jgi:hypothetical protein
MVEKWVDTKGSYLGHRQEIRRYEKKINFFLRNCHFNSLSTENLAELCGIDKKPYEKTTFGSGATVFHFSSHRTGFGDRLRSEEQKGP